MGEDDGWTALNQAITDRSLYTANLRQLRRYLKAADDHRLSAGPAMYENIQELITSRETARQARWNPDRCYRRHSRRDCVRAWTRCDVVEVGSQAQHPL